MLKTKSLVTSSIFHLSLQHLSQYLYLITHKPIATRQFTVNTLVTASYNGARDMTFSWSATNEVQNRNCGFMKFLLNLLPNKEVRNIDILGVLQVSNDK